jgi:23S rRNA (adenine1618-N6)-methyltransferase
MPSNKDLFNQNPSEKTSLHPRNPHRFRYDFEVLVATCPALKPFVFINQFHSQTIDFANTEAVKMLNKAILQQFYGIQYWDIPATYLCPPIPGRADYIHYMADLLAASDSVKIKVLDIGTGANCVYPIIGSQVYHWHFVGSDIDPVAIQSAEDIVNQNPNLKGKIECRLQANANHIFKGIIQTDDYFDLTICNPPFHTSAAEAMAGTVRKNTNLGYKNKAENLNFGGQNAELWCEGGELVFIKKMIDESSIFAGQCGWFSTLVSKKENLKGIYHQLRWQKAKDIETIEMAQGQKISRVVAWRF